MQDLAHCQAVALIEAAKCGNEHMKQTLIDAGADVHSALRMAAGKESVEVVRWLLDAGADTRWWGMFAACRNAQDFGNIDVVKLIEKRMTQ